VEGSSGVAAEGGEERSLPIVTIFLYFTEKRHSASRGGDTEEESKEKKGKRDHLPPSFSFSEKHEQGKKKGKEGKGGWG